MEKIRLACAAACCGEQQGPGTFAVYSGISSADLKVMTTPGTMLPPEEEWDFRSLPQDQLRLAVFYEYARSSPKILSVFETWHKRRLKILSVPAEWRNVTVGHVLKHPTLETLPDEVSDAVVASEPSEMSEEPFLTLRLMSRFFPAPLVTVGTIDTESIPVVPSSKSQPFRVIRPPHPQLIKYWVGNDPDLIRKRESQGIMRYTVEIDHRVAPTRIRTTFEAWLKGIKLNGIPRLSQPTGKAAVPPWDKLKELAAYRLESIWRLNYERAQRLLKQRLSEIQRNESAVKHVWPIYSRGGWSSAVTNAKKRLSSCLMELLVRL